MHGTVGGTSMVAVIWTASILVLILPLLNE